MNIKILTIIKLTISKSKIAFLASESSEFLAKKVKTQLPITAEPYTRNPKMFPVIPRSGSIFSGIKINARPKKRAMIAFRINTCFNLRAIILHPYYVIFSFIEI